MGSSGLAQRNLPKPPRFGQRNIRQRLIIFEMRRFPAAAEWSGGPGSMTLKSRSGSARFPSALRSRHRFLRLHRHPRPSASSTPPATGSPPWYTLVVAVAYHHAASCNYCAVGGSARAPCQTSKSHPPFGFQGNFQIMRKLAQFLPTHFAQSRSSLRSSALDGPMSNPCPLEVSPMAKLALSR